MKNSRFVSLVVVAVAIVTLFSACQRKYGCPTNFKVNPEVSIKQA